MDALAFFICQRLSSRKYEHVKFYVSGANVAGEGELKIMKYIKSMSETARQSDEFCLVGSDADLVLLAIASKVHHVSILNALSSTSQKLVASLPTLPPRTDRRDGHDDRKKGGNNASRKPNRDIFVEIEIDKLTREFAHLLPNANAEDVGTDFVALGILSGNDYLPKVPFYFIDQYWNHYLRARRSQAWSQVSLVDPLTGRLNLDFLNFLLANAVSRPMAAPPVHHHRKLVRLRQLRADIAAGIIDVEEIRKKYVSVADESDEEAEGMNGISEETRKEMLQLMDDLEADGGAKMEDEEDDFEDDGEGASATPQPSAPTKSAEIAVPKASETAKSGQQQQQPQRDPVDIFLDHASKDTWKDYDVNDHTSQYIYGLEWVIQSYLKGESVSYDWFFPYSSAPGPKEIREWILKTKTNPNLILSLPSHASASTNDGKATSSSATAPSSSTASIAAPTPSKRPSNIPPEPWMFAMMLLDSTTYNYLSPAIPTHTVMPGSYVHEVHDPSYFFGYIDSPKMEEELSRMDVSAMNLEDRNFSNLGHISMFERSYDRSNRDSREHYVPRSPFGEADKFYSNTLFKRVAIPDLVHHHNQAPPSNRSYQGQGNRNQGNRSDSRYQSQHGARLQHNGPASNQQGQSYQPRNNQHQGQQGQQGQQQGHQGHHHQQGVRGGRQSQPGSHQSHQGGNQQSQGRNNTQGPKHQHSGSQQDSSQQQQRRNMSTATNGAQQNSDRRNNHAGKRDARGHQKDDASTAGQSHVAADSRMQLDETAPQASQSGQKVDIGSLFVGQGPSQGMPFVPLPSAFPTHPMPSNGQFFDPMLSGGFQPMYPPTISQTAPLLGPPSFNQPFYAPPFPMAAPNASNAAPSMPLAFSPTFAAAPSNQVPFTFPSPSNQSPAPNSNPFI